MNRTLVSFVLLFILGACSGSRYVRYPQTEIQKGSFLLAVSDTVSYTIYQIIGIDHTQDSTAINGKSRPNPFSPSSSVYFYIAHDKDSIHIDMASNADSIGFRQVYSGLLPVGDYRLNLSSVNIKSGVYFIRRSIGNVSNIQKLLWIR